MKDRVNDGITRDILKNSYLELTDPEFESATMKRIARQSRRRRIAGNILLNIVAFVVIDTFIFLFLKLIGLSVFDLADGSVNLLNGILSQTGQLKGTIVGNNLGTYMLLSLGGVIAILTIAEMRISSWKGGKHGGGSILN